mmetsp:Transcript_4761/g.13872  ORF Transcript_4761/g.13872 Transcript_4761/m.13872 type:complete len:269 (-) Transcript_4761:86-892(-)
MGVYIVMFMSALFVRCTVMALNGFAAESPSDGEYPSLVRVASVNRRYRRTSYPSNLSRTSNSGSFIIFGVFRKPSNAESAAPTMPSGVRSFANLRRIRARFSSVSAESSGMETAPLRYKSPMTSGTWRKRASMPSKSDRTNVPCGKIVSNAPTGPVPRPLSAIWSTASLIEPATAPGLSMMSRMPAKRSSRDASMSKNAVSRPCCHRCRNASSALDDACRVKRRPRPLRWSPKAEGTKPGDSARRKRITLTPKKATTKIPKARLRERR